jgi:hypothetical protein
MPAEVTDDLVAKEVEAIKEEAEAATVEKAKERAKTAAQLAAERQTAIDKAAEKERQAADAARAKAHSLYCKSIAEFMDKNGVDNPRTIPDATVDLLRAGAGL